MKQAFQYKGLTIEVSEETGLDLIDRPMLNRLLADYVTGVEMTDITQMSQITWNRITTYVRQLQVSTVSGKGLTLPAVESSQDVLGQGYDDWLAYIAEHPQLYREWERVRQEVNKETADSDPQAESANEH